jgi:5-deoxy-glucuronate isomerase
MTEPGIHCAAPPNDLPAERLRLRPDPAGNVAIDPAAASWRYLSFRTTTLQPGASFGVGGADRETAIVLVSGADAVVTLADGESAELTGRESPFDALPSAYYLPAGRTASVASRGQTSSRLAIATAPTRDVVSASLRPVHIQPQDVRTEIRGAGHSTRQINHIMAPDFPADRLLVVEVVTPAGNWSSWPPHKHDVDAMPDEAVLEEVYHYRFRRPEAWAIQRVYRADSSTLGAPRDAVWAVRDGEVVVVTDGYHPFAATDADDAYYLNALAGDRRTMACSFDPTLDHVRARWSDETTDPRLPLVG